MAPVLEVVFTSAATPQKCVLIVLAATMLLTPVLFLAGRFYQFSWRPIVAELRIAEPLLGLLMGGMNSFHMGRTVQRLPYDVTFKQVAPGILEVSTLIVMGALVGLVAQGTLMLADALAYRQKALKGRGGLHRRD